jgi:histidinol-phosphate aminotransferase
VRNAGTVFLGTSASVSFGDYITGANHVLPTAGRARSSSGLTTSDFVRWTTYQRVAPPAAAALASDVEVLARAEGLPAHAAAARAWSDGAAAGSNDLSRTAMRASPARRRMADRFAAMPRYAPDRTPCRVDLSDNTNLWGVPPSAARALTEAPPSSYTRYPTAYGDALKHAIADYVGVPPECIVTGCGSDDVLDSALRALAAPGTCLAHPDPTFAMVPLFAAVNGIPTRPVPLTPQLDADAPALLATDAEIIYLCTPNNPVGASLPRTTVECVAEHARGIVIVDEAYTEFADHSHAPLAIRYEHVFVTRTLSKAFGLAGLRVGYGVGAPALVAAVEKARGPYKVSAVAERAAIAALCHDRAWMHEHVQLLRDSRARFVAALHALGGVVPLPSDANFVLVRLLPDTMAAGIDALTLSRRLRARGVAVRAFTSLTGVGDAIRITIGPWDQMRDCLAALQAELICA